MAEGFGGKQDSVFFYATGRDYDGLVISELPDEVSAEALAMTVRATGNLQKLEIIPLVTAEQFKMAMERAQQAKTGYTPPTLTK